MASPQNTAPHEAAPAEPRPDLRPDLRVVPAPRPAGQAAGARRAPKPKAPARHKADTRDEWSRVRGLAMKQLDRCVSLQPKVLRGDDADAVHDLRVATRRLQQVLDLMFAAPQPGEIRKLRKRLKRCRGALSEVRNCDVLLARVDASLAHKRTSHREARGAIREYLAARRASNLKKALRKLTAANLSEVYVRLKDCLLKHGEAVEAGANSPGPSGQQTRAVERLHSTAAQNLKSVWANFENQVLRSRRRPEAATLHRVRIAAKRVRYLVEVFHAFEVEGSAEVLVWLRGLQKHLGNWHDLLVFEETVIEMIADPDFLRDHLELAMDVEKLILKNRKLKTRLEAKYLEAVGHRADLLRARNWTKKIVAEPAAAFAHS